MSAALTDPGLLDPAGFVAYRRARGVGWNSIAIMLGRPVDSVRRDYDRGYQPVHKPAEPVCKGPTRGKIERAAALALSVEPCDPRVIGVLWAAREPLGVEQIADRGQVWLDHSVKERERYARRFLKRAGEAGIEIDTGGGTRGWRLTEAGRARLIKLAGALLG